MLKRVSDVGLSVLIGFVGLVLTVFGAALAFFAPTNDWERWACVWLVFFVGASGLLLVAEQAKRTRNGQLETDANLRFLVKKAEEESGPSLLVKTGYLAADVFTARTNMTVLNRSSRHPVHLFFKAIEKDNPHALWPIPATMDHADQKAVAAMFNAAPVELLPLQTKSFDIQFVRWIEDKATKAPQDLTLEITDQASGRVFNMSLPGTARWP